MKNITRFTVLTIVLFSFTIQACRTSKNVIDDKAMRRKIMPNESIGLVFWQPRVSAWKKKLSSSAQDKLDKIKYMAVRKFIKKGYRVKALEMLWLDVNEPYEDLSLAINRALEGTKNRANYNDIIKSYYNSKKYMSNAVLRQIVIKQELAKLKANLNLDLILFFKISDKKSYELMVLDLTEYEIIYSHRYVPKSKRGMSDEAKIAKKKTEAEYAIDHFIYSMQGRKTPDPKLDK